MRLPFGPPTWTTCVLTIPAGAPGIEVSIETGVGADTVAARVSDAAMVPSPACVVAAAKPSRADAITDLEKSMM